MAAFKMKLTDLSRRLNMHHCEFRKKRDMASHCHYVWIKFFWHLRPGEPWIDAAVWDIGPTVQVRPASTAIDESRRSFVKPQPVYFDVRGYSRELGAIKRQTKGDPSAIEAKSGELQDELFEQMREAITRGFAHKRVQKYFEQYNPKNRPFTVLMTHDDKGLQASEFTIAWTNRKSLSLSRLRKQIAAAKGKPQPMKPREDSIKTRHLAKLAEKEKKDEKASRAYWEAEKKKAEKRKPAIRKKLVAQMEKAEKALPKKTRKRKASKIRFPFRLDDGNQHERKTAPSVTVDRLVDIMAEYKWADFDQYDNRTWEYMTEFSNPSSKSCVEGRRRDVGRMNRPQKVFYAILAFTGETDNGGVWQFLFNDPDLSLAALEAMHEIGLPQLAADYQRTLEEVVGKARSLAELKKRFASKKLTSAERWTAFAEGYDQLESPAKIQGYFYSETFKRNSARRWRTTSKPASTCSLTSRGGSQDHPRRQELQGVVGVGEGDYRGDGCVAAKSSLAGDRSCSVTSWSSGSAC